MKDKYFFHHLNSRFFEISGKDSKSFIQNLITNDIEKCNDGEIIYSCILTPQGKFLADFFIFTLNKNESASHLLLVALRRVLATFR